MHCCMPWPHAKGEATKAELYREVWGYRSMPQGRALDYAIRRLRQKIGDEASKPEFLTSRRGGGFRLEWLPIVNEASASSYQSPVITTDWYGDRAQVDLLKRRLVEGPRIISILGPAGVGKSRLLLEALEGYEGEIVWFSLHEERDIWSVLADLCDAYKAKDVPLIGQLDSLFDELAGAIGQSEKVPHLVLDGAEEHNIELTSRLGELVKGNNLRIFVTSRIRLGLVGEELIDVAPLEPVMGVEFLQSRRASQSDYESADLIELVRLLDGLPLALELVAPLLRMVTPTQLVERLRNSGNASALQSEFRPLIGLVEGAIIQLDQPQQRLLRVLAQLPRGATLEMVEVFLSYLDAGLGTLRELVDRSLVSSFDDGKQGRRLRVMWAVRSLVSSAGPDESGWGSVEARAILARHACSFGVVEDRWALFHESNVHLRESMRAELGQAHVWLMR